MEWPPQDQRQGPRQCSSINEFPTMEDLEVQSAVKVEFRYNSTILIPDMRLTCSGVISKVIIAGMMSDNHTMGNQSMKLQIWRKKIVPEPERKFYRVNEIALPSTCEFNMLTEWTKMFRTFICECTLNISINVKSGDILGIELPPEDVADFELYSLTECMVTNYIFKRNLSLTTDLHNGDKEKTAQPFIRIELKGRLIAIMIVHTGPWQV